jgi:DnaJ family protein A protein 2
MLERCIINSVIKEKEHDVFERKGADLLITRTLTLNEALCGFAFQIKHLDGHQVVVKSQPGEVISAEAAGVPICKIVPNEGMPSQGNPDIKGNLYVLFQVKFPQDGEISPEAVKMLRRYLPGKSMDIGYKPEEVEIVHLEPADAQQFGTGGLIYDSSDNDSADEDEDDDDWGVVQCQQS